MSQTNQVLIIDDDKNTLQLINMSLNSLGASSIMVENGEKALEILNEQPETISLVLLDIAMPHMNGFEVSQAIKANPLTARIPIIAVTARDTGEVQILAEEVGIEEIIGKPFKLADIRNILQKYQIIN